MAGTNKDGGGGNYIWMTSEFNVLDKWYHIAMVKEANRLLLYKDAVLIGT